MNNPHSPDSSAEQRALMIEQQLRPRGIRDERLLAVMAKVPREPFLLNLEADCSRAYGDFPLPIGAGQTMSQPYMVAAMVESLQFGPETCVLEVGTGTGYEAAVLGELADQV